MRRAGTERTSSGESTEAQAALFAPYSFTGMCHICELNAEGDRLPFSERLYVNDNWRVAHGRSSLPGWLVVALRRHAQAIDQLTAQEAEELGSILRAAGIALKRIVGCEKTYVMLFAERSIRHE
jgi:diadenosine tetraphosphate (Ap4A) HIT family hydrolase